MKRRRPTPTFYEKLTSQRHLGLDGLETYSTHPGPGGLIICRRPGSLDTRILLVADGDTGRITLYNLDTKQERQTFRFAQNCCAEELHKEIELLSATA